jgi:integrase/recombinase XerD
MRPSVAAKADFKPARESRLQEVRPMTEMSIKLFEEYIARLGVKGRSTKNAKTNIKLFFKYLDSAGLDPLRLTLRDAEEYRSYIMDLTSPSGELRYSKASASGMIGSIRVFYEYLKKRNLIASNPFRDIGPIRLGKHLPKNIAGEDEISKLLGRLTRFWEGKDLIEKRNLYRLHVMAELMYATGCRVNEVMRMRADDIDLVRGLVRIKDTKSGKFRDVILTSLSEKVLRIYIDELKDLVSGHAHSADKNLLFGSSVNLKPWCNALLGRESVRLGLPKMTSHHFRHALGYHLLKNGCDIRYIQDILGHRDIRSTSVYTMVDRDDLRKVIDELHPRRLSVSKADNHENGVDDFSEDKVEAKLDENP